MEVKVVDEKPIVDRTRRTRGLNDGGRKEALERLKAHRRGGGRRSKAGFQIKLEDPIYDTLSEDE